MAGTFSGMGELPDITVLRDFAREELVTHLESVRGCKDLVLDPELMKPLDRIAGASLLKEHGVDKIFKLEPPTKVKHLRGCDQRIYIIHPKLDSIKYIADHINAEKGQGDKRTYKILMTPRKLHVCEKLLEQEGVFGYVDVSSMALNMIPIDKDIISLELPQFFTSYFMDGDQTWCHTAAMALVDLQQMFGQISDVYGIGKCSQTVYELSELLMEQFESVKPSQTLGQLILVDRDTDYVTPLLSQVTYEGLLQDTFNMECGFVDFPPEVSGRDTSIKMLLTSYDEVYEDIRNRHFSTVFTYLSQTARALQRQYDKRHTITSVSEMKEFVSKDLKGLKQQHKSLALHVGACEVISGIKTKNSFDLQLRTEHWLLEGVEIKENMNYIEEMINRQLGSTQCLQLLCLLSLTQGGLSNQVYTSLKTQYVHSFGFDSLVAFHNLKKLGMFVQSQISDAEKHLGKMAVVIGVKSCPFRTVCKKLNLIPKSAEEVNLKAPNDMSYVFSGAYTPILPKLVEEVLSKQGFNSVDDILKLISCPHFTRKHAKSAKGKGASTEENPWHRVVVVYFLGGCTYSEIAALRFLGKQRGYKFIILTTAIVNGRSFIGLCEKG